MGDLSENADYISAKEEQGFLEGRIQELEYILHNAQIIAENSTGPRETVEVGTTVTIQETGFPPEVYYMVGSKEADPEQGRISNESPIGQALLGKRVGNRVKVKTPAGELIFEILKIE
jgi:transcription elongation factor GreA